MTELLPADPDAERAVLGAILFDNECWATVAGTLTSEDFSSNALRLTFSAMEKLLANGDVVDLVMLAHRLRDDGKLDAVGGLSALSDLDPSPAKVFGVGSYVKCVKEKSLQRKIILTLNVALKECTSEVGDVYSTLERLNKAAQELRLDPAPNGRLKTTADLIIEKGGLDSFMSNTRASVTTPWPGLNRILGGGFRDAEMVILAARTSVGKTACALQMAVHAADRGIPTAIFSLEMGPTPLIHRMACTRGCVDSNSLRNDRLTNEQRRALHVAVGEIIAMPIYFGTESAYTVASITSALKSLKESGHRPGFVVVDYLQLVDAGGRQQNRTETVGAVSRGLKVAAVEFNVPFLVLAQLSRAADDSDTVPALRHLRESGSQEQDADTVIFLHVNERHRYGDIRPTKVTVAKQRNGPLGCIDLDFRGVYTRFEESISAGAVGAA